MLIPGKAFKVEKLAAREATRYAMGGVLVERGADGKARLVATDGRRLGIVTWHEEEPGEFPAIDGLASARGGAMRAIIPIADAAALAKAKAPKSKPILANVLMDEASVNGKAEFATTDLERVSRTSSRTIDGEFPAFDRPNAGVIPTGEPVVTITVNPALLAELLMVAEAIACPSDLPAVRLSIYGDNVPMRVDAEANGVSFMGLLMPITAEG